MDQYAVPGPGGLVFLDPERVVAVPFVAGDRVRLSSKRFRGWARGRGVVVGCQGFRGGWFVTVRWSRSGLMTHADVDLELVDGLEAQKGKP